MTDPLWVVDAHGDYQHGMSVDVLASEGYAALTVKISEGTSYVAPQENFDWLRRDAELGMIGGGYHYLRAKNGRTQCRVFKDSMARVGGCDGKLVQLDCEADGYETEIIDWLDEFWLDYPGHPVLIYSGPWWWNSATRPVRLDVASLGPTFLWDSHYVPGNGLGSVLYEQVPDWWWTPTYGGFAATALLQFSSRATAGTITGNVDVSAFRGTRDQLLALTRADGGSDMADAVTAVTVYGGTSMGPSVPPESRFGDDPTMKPDATGRFFNGLAYRLYHNQRLLEQLLARPAGQFTDEQVDQITAAITAHPDTPLGDADKPAIRAALIEGLRELVAGAAPPAV